MDKLEVRGMANFSNMGLKKDGQSKKQKKKWVLCVLWCNVMYNCSISIGAVR